MAKEGRLSVGSAGDTFPIVAIGASAGGIRALGLFFDAVPPDIRMAFVVVLHLHATTTSHVADVLATHTALPTVEVTKPTRVDAGRIFVIAANRALTIRGGVLYAPPRREPPGLHRPIDVFFQSLAKDQGERAVAVVLSGAGSDASIGIKAVKEHMGTVLAQDPATAEHASMPSSAIATGMVDGILAPGAMPAALLRFVRHPQEPPAYGTEGGTPSGDLHLAMCLSLLRERLGRDYSGYRKAMLCRRIARRQRLRGVERLADYVTMVDAEPDELAALNGDLMIAVTGFFRDPDAWEELDRQVIAPLVAAARPGRAIRVWVPGCATGEEAYSVGMLLLERIRSSGRQLEVKIFATDAAETALAVARAGRYPVAALAEMAPARAEAFFEHEADHVRVGKGLRDLIVFAQHDALRDPPFSRLDLVSCRNVLIYVEPVVQNRIVALFHFGLRDGGCLFLGKVESIGRQHDLFVALSRKHRIYRRIGATRRDPVDPPRQAPARLPRRAASAAFAPAEPVGLAVLTREALLARFLPASVLIDSAHRVHYYHGPTDRFLAQPTGEPTSDLLALTRRGLVGPSRRAIQRAVRTGATAVERGSVRRREGQMSLRVEVSPLSAGHGAGTLLVSYVEDGEAAVAAPASDTDETARELELEEAIGLVGAELRITVDRMATTNEELRASNEDIVSMNEELQSTNEELEAAKEEQQSLNEELTIVNAQLQDKLEELELRTADLDNLLNGTEIATLFLDHEMRIRWYTPTMVALLSVKPADLGRSLADFACRFDDDEFLSDAIAVQQTLAPRIREMRGPGKRWYLRRLLPYRIGGDRVDGVVATFVDITDRRQAEQECRAAMVYAESIVETVREPLLVLGPELRVRTANSAFYRTFEAEPQTIIGRPLNEIAEREWDVPQLHRLLTQVLLEKSTFESFEVERDFRGIGRRVMLLNARRLDDTPLILLAIEDITLRRAAEQLARDLGLRDPLTGLASRSLFHDRLIQAIALARRSGRPLAVLLLDLDHFKDINDTLGHSQGDALLVAAAARLQACVRQTDTVARLGGDEFIMVLGELTNPQQAAVLAEKMIAEIGHPFVIDGQEVHIGASCGIAMHLPSGPGTDPDLILKNVDLALYRAKDEGRGSFCFYAPELTAAVKERKLLEHDLRLGLELGEFDLHYQPQVAVADGRLIGVEALLRWRSARRGSVLPGEFVPRAEESGLIVPLGAWVLHAACRQIGAWREAGLRPPVVAVNVSPIQCRRGKLDVLVAEILQSSGVETSNFELEVTEGLFLTTTAQDCLGMLHRLHDRGVRLAIDDFGTGYSSLGQLRRFPVDKVKIDRSFVAGLGRDRDADAIVRAAIKLAHALGMVVVAEGVETEEQLTFLHAEECDAIQGFLVGRAIPAVEFNMYLDPGWRADVVASA